MLAKTQKTTIAKRRIKSRADAVIKFIECLTVPSGVGQGGPFKLRPWQQNFLRDIYEPHNHLGNRTVRRAILSIARKNGKTALIAAIALAHLIGPEAIPNGEIYSVANDREQAAIVFKVAAQIVRADPELKSMLKIIDSTKTIANYRNGSVYRAVSAESGTKHGLNPTVVIYDELAQAKSRDLYDVMDTSMGAREEPLFIIISTQSNDPQHILSQLIDDAENGEDETLVCHVYAVPESEQEIFSEDVWMLANPALGDFRDIEDFRTLAARAERMPSEEPKFRNLYLNQRVSPVSSLISRKEWMACVSDKEIEDGARVYLGLDLSSVNDLSALVMITDEVPSVVRAWLWKPRELLREHSDRDFGHGNWRYEEWFKEGHLEVSEGKVINHRDIALKLKELHEKYEVVGCAYDRHKMEYLLRTFGEVGLEAHKSDDEAQSYNSLRLVPFGQGFISMGPAVDAFESMITKEELLHKSNPVLNWCMANAVAVMDPAGNRKLDKDKARFRIDGAVALVMACGLRARENDDNSIGDFLKNAVMS